MTTNHAKPTHAQTLAGVAIALTVAALLMFVIAAATQQVGMMTFGAVLLGLAFALGMAGIIWNSFRR